VVERVSDAELKVSGQPDAEPGTLYLERAYGLYQGDPEALDSLVEKTASAVGFKDPGASSDTLLVLVRPAPFVQASKEVQATLNRPLAGGLYAIVATDTPERYVFSRANSLRSELKLADAEIWSQALRNTRRLVGAKPLTFRPGRLAEITTENGLAASLLALDDYWDSEALMANGPLVVAVLARDDLFVAPLADRAAVASLRKMMSSARDDPNGLTNDLLVRRAGRWEALRE
jgi:hypothetical protein